MRRRTYETITNDCCSLVGAIYSEFNAFVTSGHAFLRHRDLMMSWHNQQCQFDSVLASLQVAASPGPFITMLVQCWESSAQTVADALSGRRPVSMIRSSDAALPAIADSECLDATDGHALASPAVPSFSDEAAELVCLRVSSWEPSRLHLVRSRGITVGGD